MYQGSKARRVIRSSLPQRTLLVLCCVLFADLALAGDTTRRSSIARTSRWWMLTCDDAAPAPCLLTVRLRGRIDRSRLRLVEEAVRRRGVAQGALGRNVELRLDVDTRGGEIFAAMEIGRLLRRELAAVHVAAGAECSSACVFVLMGAPLRSVAPGARVGIHRPTLGVAGSGALEEPLRAQAALYAEEMNVSDGIIDGMMSVRGRRLRYLTAADLAAYGISVTMTR
jgi:ATP-dependent protease ClpP protease subunit